MTPAILQAAQDHASVLEALHATSFPTPWQANEFATLLNQPGVAGWIAADRDEPLGFILVRAVADEAEILTIAVDPAHRRKGIAAQLMHVATETLRSGKTQHLFLEVAADNAAALALYKNHGFEDCGRRPDYYGGISQPRVDAIVMRRTL